MKKAFKMVALALAGVMVAGSLWCPMSEVKAAGAERAGLKDFEIHKMSEKKFTEFLEENEEASDEALENGAEEVKIGGEEIVTFYKETHASAVSGPYSAYTTDRVYNTMNRAQKQFYDDLYATCESYLTGNASLYYSSSYNESYIAPVYAQGLSTNAAIDVLYFFNFSNPQFYFLSNGILYGTDGGGTYYCLSCYNAFCDGNARAQASNQVFGEANRIVAEANKQSTVCGKLRAAEEILVRKVSYVSNEYDQSCYGALILNQGVCASYSEAYEMICNAMGISTIAVTSEGHEWNEVYVNGSWYIVDATWDDWDDSNGTVDTAYFLKSYATINSYGSYDAESHLIEQSTWGTISAPPCNRDFVEAENVSATPDQATLDQLCGGTVSGSGYTGLAAWEDGNWYLFENGGVNWGYSGLYYDATYGWWLVLNGRVAFEYNDLYCDANYGWWLVTGGAVNFEYNDLFYSPTYGWWLVTGGAVNFGYNDLFGSPQYGWWLVNGGAVNFGYNDLFYSPSCGWWLVNGGAVNFGYNDLFYSPTLGWWLVNGGAVNFGYYDWFCSPQFGWWYINGGSVVF